MYCYKLCNMFFFNNNLKICGTKGSNSLSSFQCTFQKHIGTASLCWLLCFVFIFTSFSLFPLICCTCLVFFTHVFPTTQINVCVFTASVFSLPFCLSTCYSYSTPVSIHGLCLLQPLWTSSKLKYRFFFESTLSPPRDSYHLTLQLCSDYQSFILWLLPVPNCGWLTMLMILATTGSCFQF